MIIYIREKLYVANKQGIHSINSTGSFSHISNILKNFLRVPKCKILNIAFYHFLPRFLSYDIFVLFRRVLTLETESEFFSAPKQ